MQRTILRRAVLIGMFLLLCALSIKAQQTDDTDICILEHLTAHSLAGRVVSARLENQSERSIADAVIELRHIGDDAVIAKTTTDSDGRFVLSDIARGAYSLAAKAPGSYRPVLFSTAVEIRFTKAKTEKKPKEIILALGWLSNGCHGGYAQVRNITK